MVAVNNLIQQGRIRIYSEGIKKSIIYKEVSPEEAALFHGLLPEDITVYDIIKQGGNKGEWLKNIKYKSKLTPKQYNASLKKLKAKNLIKSVKTIHGKNKIVYMLANLEPSREVTGGVWYTGTDFNTNLIAELQREACQYILLKKQCTVADVLDHVRKKGLSAEIDLRGEDMQSIIDTLIYDGLVDRSFDVRSGTYTYKPMNALTPENAFSEIPCSTCPVFDQCTDNGDINPQSCIYLRQWIEF